MGSLPPDSFIDLDHWINYDGIRGDCVSGPTLLQYLEEAKSDLRLFFDRNYVAFDSTLTSKSEKTNDASVVSISAPHQPLKAPSSTAHYEKKDFNHQ